MDGKGWKSIGKNVVVLLNVKQLNVCVVGKSLQTMQIDEKIRCINIKEVSKNDGTRISSIE